MTRIPIITQNFSSPDGYNDTPLMLLPQSSTLPLSDKDQEGFSQLLLHDLHRHRQSYVRNYTAFETLKKRQDFILRQENLRSLQNFEQRISNKQEQFIDQSIHSYEQCFVKVINGYSTANRHNQEQQSRPHTAAPSFDRFHNHQLSHTTPTAQHKSSTILPFQRYQKSHRPTVPSKYRCVTSIQHSAQSFHDAFQSPSVTTTQSQPFLSFTENYLQKYGDRTANKTQSKNAYDDESIEFKEPDDVHDSRPTYVRPRTAVAQTKRRTQKSITPDLQKNRSNPTSRNTNTPSTTPQLGINDALRDGLTIDKDDDSQHTKLLSAIEKRRSSQQSAGHSSNNDSRTNIKRPKTTKKKHTNVDTTSEKKAEPLTTKTTDSGLLKKAMIVQNYGSNNIDLKSSLNAEQSQFPASTNALEVKGIGSPIRRLSVRSTGSNSEMKQQIDIQATTKMMSPPPTTPIPGQHESVTGSEVVDANTEPSQNLLTSNTTIENVQSTSEKVTPSKPELATVENRKRVKKNAFDMGDSMNDLIAFELGLMGTKAGAMKKSKFRFGKENESHDNEVIPSENQDSLDLLEKIRQTATGVSIGQLPLSQQGCRFELPFDLKILENLTPLDYLSKYCRISGRRNYQFKRTFDKFRNNQYRIDSTHLFASAVEIHRDKFTRTQYDQLCELIDLGTEQYQFTYDTFAGILALCERMLFDPKALPSGPDERDFAKGALERCDFDSLDRKLAGLSVNEKMKKLLKTL